MWTIAGGIILAVICLALLPVIGYVAVMVIAFVASIALVYLAVENIGLVILFGIPVAAIYFYVKKQEEKKEEMQKVFLQLDARHNLDKIYMEKGVLLLNANKTKNGDYSRNIEIGKFCINISYYFSSKSYFMSFKKNGDSFKKLETYSNDWEWAPTDLTVDDVFLLDKELKEFIENDFEKELFVCRTKQSDGVGFFEDAKNYERSNTAIFIFQHLITQEGIETVKPIMCVEKIIANIAVNYDKPSVKIYIENDYVAEVTAQKWNELRKNGKIKFASEMKIWSQHEKQTST